MSPALTLHEAVKSVLVPLPGRKASARYISDKFAAAHKEQLHEAALCVSEEFLA